MFASTKTKIIFAVFAFGIFSLLFTNTDFTVKRNFLADTLPTCDSSKDIACDPKIDCQNKGGSWDGAKCLITTQPVSSSTNTQSTDSTNSQSSASTLNGQITSTAPYNNIPPTTNQISGTVPFQPPPNINNQPVGSIPFQPFPVLNNPPSGTMPFYPPSEVTNQTFGITPVQPSPWINGQYIPPTDGQPQNQFQFSSSQPLDEETIKLMQSRLNTDAPSYSEEEIKLMKSRMEPQQQFNNNSQPDYEENQRQYDYEMFPENSDSTDRKIPSFLLEDEETNITTSEDEQEEDSPLFAPKKKSLSDLLQTKKTTLQSNKKTPIKTKTQTNKKQLNISDINLDFDKLFEQKQRQPKENKNILANITDELEADCNGEKHCSFLENAKKLINKPEKGGPPTERLKELKDEQKKWGINTLKNQGLGHNNIKNKRLEFWKSIVKQEKKIDSNIDDIGSEFIAEVIGDNALISESDEQAVSAIKEEVSEISEILQEKKEEIEENGIKVPSFTFAVAAKVEEQITEYQEEKEKILDQPVVTEVKEKIDEKAKEIIQPDLQEKITRQDMETEQNVIIKIDPEELKEKLPLIKNIIPDVEITDNYLSGSVSTEELLTLANSFDGETEIHEDKPVFLALSNASISTGVFAVEKLKLTGKNIKIAILDTGIDDKHPGLKDKIINSVDFTGEGTQDDNGHGTHVSYIIAGANNENVYQGIAPDSKILSVKIMDKDGAGYQSDAIKGIAWAKEHGADIINISLGTPVDVCDGSDALSQAVKDAVEQGIIVTVAAGNFGPDANTVASPGCAKDAITVGAVDKDGIIASFSSRGDSKPDIYAPGVKIASGWPGGKYAALSGTSQASPQIAGILALLKEIDPSLTPANAKNILLGTFEPLKENASTGRVNAYNAVSQYLSLKDLINKNSAETQTEVKTDSETKQSTETKQEKEKPPEKPADDGKKSSSKKTKEKIKAQSKIKKLSTEEEEIIDMPAPKIPIPVQLIQDKFKSCSINSNMKNEKDICFKNLLKDQILMQEDRLSSEDKQITEDLRTNIEVVKKSAKNYSSETEKKVIELEDLFSTSIVIGDSAKKILEQLIELVKEINSKNKNNDEIKNLILKVNETFNKEYQKTTEEKYNKNIIPFKDILENTWFFLYIQNMKDRKVISGYKDKDGKSLGLFGPSDNVTIAEALKMVLEISDKKPSNIRQESKNPSANSHWAKQYFIQGEELNLSLTKHTAENPNRHITRSEFIRLLFEANNIGLGRIDTAIFQDVPLTHPDAEIIYTVYNLGIISGDSNNNTFRPKDKINRAEVSKILAEF